MLILIVCGLARSLLGAGMEEGGMVVLVDNGHGRQTPGKRSPDGSLLEWEWTRGAAASVVSELRSRGVDARILVPEDDDVPLAERVRRVDAVCDSVGASRVLLVSVHVNASGSGQQWMPASGWSAYTSPGHTRADSLADCLYRAARAACASGSDGLDHGLSSFRIRTDYGDGDADFEAPFYLLRRTRCAAVLTENFFMDNRSDHALLLSERGRRLVVAIHVVGILMYISGLCALLLLCFGGRPGRRDEIL